MDKLESSTDEESAKHNNHDDENVLEETSTEETIPDLCHGSIEPNTHNNSISNANPENDVLTNRIFAKQNEDGNWLLRWNVEKQSEKDFLALCYKGKFDFKYFQFYRNK